MNPDQNSDPDPVIFIIDLHKTNKKLIIFIQFFYLKLFEGTLHLHHISKIKSPKEVTNHRIHIFLGLLDPDPGPALARDRDPDIITQI